MAKPLTADEVAWFDSPITVQVEPDNQRWLDALLEMKPDELRSYAVFQYQIPKDTIIQASRDSIMQLVVLANRNGGGGSVVRARYRYIPGLKGILDPAITSRRGRLLFLTRGADDSMQVYSSKTDEWIALSSLTATPRPLSRSEQRRHEVTAEGSAGFSNEFSPAAQREKARKEAEAAALDQDDDDEDEQDETTPPAAAPALYGAILASMPKMARAQLEEVAKSLGAPDTSEDKFATNQDLKDYITNAINAQAGGGDE